MKHFVKQVQKKNCRRSYSRLSDFVCDYGSHVAIIFFFFCAQMFAPMTVHAAGGAFGVGSGTGLTSLDPLIIEDEADLNAVRGGLALHYKLNSDVILTGAFQPAGLGWTPIASASSGGFTGSLDGNGYTISGLWIESTGGHVGLFGYARDASFKDLCIVLHNNGIKGTNRVGGLVGFLHARDNNCQITNCCVVGKIEGNENVGGLVGWLYSNGGVTARLMELYNCYSNCEITGNRYVGGLVGMQSAESSVSTSMIKNCYAVGTVNASGNEIGGLVGRQYSEGSCSIINCYASVDVSGDSRVGGLVGILDANNGECIVTNSFSVGHVSGINFHYYGLIGTRLIEPGSTTSSFIVEYNYRYQFATVNGALIPSGGENKHDGLHGLSIAAIEFMTKGSYTGWNFDPTTGGPWYWDIDKKFPQLGFGTEDYPFPFFAITYDADGGILPSGLLDSYDPTNNPSLLTYNLLEPTKTHYSFDGWFDSSITLMRDIKAVDTGHKNLVAKWTRVEFDINVDPLSDGTVTPNVLFSAAGATITLNVTPDPDFLFDGMTVYQTGNPSNIIATWNASSAMPYTFAMPAYDVNVKATFEYIYKSAVDQAIALIEQYIFNYQQKYYGGIDDVIDQIVIDINKLIESTGIKITKTDISLRSFVQPIAGDAKTPAGKNGIFEFRVWITKGTYSRATTPLTGIHTAMAYIAPTFNIYLNPTINGIVKANRTISPAYEMITLTIAETVNYELDSLWVIRTGPLYYTINPVELSGTGNVRTFIMPNYDVTVTATFKLRRDVSNETVLQSSALKAWVENESLHVTGLSAGQIWRVYSLSGTMVYQGMADESGNAIITLSGKGIYLIQSENKAIKVIKN